MFDRPNLRDDHGIPPGGPTWTTDRDLAARYRVLLLVLLSGFLGATMAPPVVAQRLHAIVVGDLSPSAGWGKYAPNITLDMLTMYVVLHENVPEDRLEYLPVSIEADEDSAPQLLLRLLDELHPKPNDTLLFYYTGHGAADDRGHYFALAQGPLYRDDLLNQLRGKGARLTVLLSDCCNARSDGRAYLAPAPRVNEPPTITPVFQSLFFEPRGVVDVNSSSPGESAFFVPETEASKTMPGSLFTKQLADWFTQQKRRSATWDQLLRSVSLQVHVAFRDGYPRGAEVAKGAARQMDQNVYAVAYPGMPERSGPRTGLIVRDHAGHGALDHRSGTGFTRRFKPSTCTAAAPALCTPDS